MKCNGMKHGDGEDVIHTLPSNKTEVEVVLVNEIREGEEGIGILE